MRFMLGRKGQAYDAMKFLQGGVIAVVLLGIIYGGIQLVKDYEPGSDVEHVTAGLLSSAYSAAGTGVSFTRRGRLVQEIITNEGLKSLAGIDNPNLNIYFHCVLPVGTGLNHKSCDSNNGVSGVQLKEGTTIPICVVCGSLKRCDVYLGKDKC